MTTGAAHLNRDPLVAVLGVAVVAIGGGMLLGGEERASGGKLPHAVMINRVAKKATLMLP
jgi:hypothetical protein